MIKSLTNYINKQCILRFYPNKHHEKTCMNRINNCINYSKHSL